MPHLGVPAFEPDVYRALVHLDARFVVVMWDKGAEWLFGWRGAEARGASWSTLVAAEPARWQRLQTQLRDGAVAVVSVEQFVGKYRPVLVPVRITAVGWPKAIAYRVECVKQPATKPPQNPGSRYHGVTTLLRRANWQGEDRRAEWRDMEAARIIESKRLLVGKNIRRARKLNPGMSQPVLAERLGIDPPALSAYENGRHEPSWERLTEIARLTGVPEPGWFYADHSDLDAIVTDDDEDES